MRDGYRTCPACGEDKPEAQFWEQARRCRQCVAREVGQKRSAEAREHRSRVREEFDLRIAPSQPRFSQSEVSARRKAESLVPKTDKDRLASMIYAGLLVGFFASLIALFTFAWPALLVPAAMVGAFFWLGPLATRLAEPRRTAVREIGDKILRDDLLQLEAEQLEYLRFYITPEWRAVREVVMQRDGKVCKRCGQREDLTVDHILPRSKYPARALDPDNLQVLCRSCNSAKGSSVPR